jgi:hypothetical protein
MAGMLVAFALGAATAVALSVTVVLLGLQWLTKYPLRWGWRSHSERVGVQLPNGDPRLETKPPRSYISRRHYQAQL